MKSKILKVNNIPNSNKIMELKTKPTYIFVLGFLAGFALLFADKIYQPMSLILIGYCIFALFFAPNRTLMQFTGDFIVLYNQINPDECKIVYYNEILSWDYVVKTNCDYLVLELLDGSIEKCESFNKFNIIHCMNTMAYGKRRKKVKGRNI